MPLSDGVSKLLVFEAKRMLPRLSLTPVAPLAGEICVTSGASLGQGVGPRVPVPDWETPEPAQPIKAAGSVNPRRADHSSDARIEGHQPFLSPA
jgi:hypothetical protein